MRWYRGGCPVCGGDLHDDLDDEGWVICFACSRSFDGAKLGLRAPVPPTRATHIPWNDPEARGPETRDEGQSTEPGAA